MPAILRWYNAILNQRPLVTQVVTSGTISAIGDALTQFAFENRSRDNYDLWRTARFFAVAGCFAAPCLNRWFLLLERKIQGGRLLPRRLVPFKRLVVDQTFFAPAFNAALLMNLRLLEGFSTQVSWDMMKKDWAAVYLNGMKVWPLVQLVNFYLVPFNWRVLVVQAVALFMSGVLSYRTQKKVEIVDGEVECVSML